MDYAILVAQHDDVNINVDCGTVLGSRVLTVQYYYVVKIL